MAQNISKQEFDENQYLLELITDSRVKTRIANNLRWFISHANSAKFYYYLLTIISIVSPIISGIVLNAFSGDLSKTISSILLGIASVSVALNSMWNFQKKWVIYRAQAEEIKRQLARLTYEENVKEMEIVKKIESTINSTDKKWSSQQGKFE